MSGSDRAFVVERRKRRPGVRMTQVAERETARCVPHPEREPQRAKLMRALAEDALGAARVRKAERLRAKGWTAKGIAAQLGTGIGVIEALLGITQDAERAR